LIGDEIVVTIQLEPVQEEQLRELATSQGQDASELAKRVVEEFLHLSLLNLATPGASRLPKAEAQLLQEINQGLSETTWRRYHDLIARRRDGTLTADEHAELKTLTDDVELAHARRLEKLVELARLRHVSLDDLMTELGIRDPGYV
jgi:hypothetical protein